MAEHAHPSHEGHHGLNPWLLGGLGAAGALMLSPYVLPSIGVGDAESAGHLMGLIGGRPDITGFGTGLAGALQQTLAGIPVIGGALTSTAPVAIPGLGLSIASGALVTLAATAGIGIGGALLANWMEKRERPGQFPWSQVIRYGSLATSMLIALPSLLGAISVGMAFLGFLVRPLVGFQTSAFMANSLGATSMASGGEALTGLASILPHFFTCGLPFLPLAAAMLMGKRTASATSDAQIELVSAEPPLQQGKRSELAFRIRDGNGNPMPPESIATTHTHTLHTMVVDSSLTDYHHLHPHYDAQRGLYVAAITPRLSSAYKAWNDFTPVGAETPLHQPLELPAGNGIYALPACLSPSRTADAGGLHMALEPSDELEAGQAGTLRLRITDAHGTPVNALEPIMGAYGHLAGFSADGQHFIHSHPLTPLEQPLSHGELVFHVAPEQAGMTKFFLQIKYQGQERVLPFARPVRAAERFSEQAQASQADAHQHHARA